MTESTALEKTLRLSALENERHEKRLEVEKLYQQKLNIESSLATLEKQLLRLDQEIDALDYDEEDDTDQPSSSSSVRPPSERPSLHQSQASSSTSTARTTNNKPKAPAATLDSFLGVKRPPPQPTPPSTIHTSQATSSTFASTLPPTRTITPHQHQQRPSSSTSSPFPDAQLQHTLETIFHIPSFRTHQREIIQATLSCRDVFCIMRTGGGKSLTYQLPAYLEGRCSPQRKITFCISPLLSLIHDQVQQMNAFCPNSALALVSKLAAKELAQRWQQIRDPHSGICLVYCTPERVHQSQKLLSELQKLHDQNRLGRFVIDEAHCATQYGHDFRPDYAQLGKLKAHFGASIPVLAVTATASERVREEVTTLLRLSNPLVLRSTAARPNLDYSVLRKTQNLQTTLVEWILQQTSTTTSTKPAGIVYTLSKKDAETIAKLLREHGITASAYHSEVKQKEQIQEQWMQNKLQVVVATIAFGLGINKPDVRFVIHHSLSKTLEAYYQESGRAGRDGKPARCVLFYSPKDVIRMYKLVHGTNSEHLLFPMIRYGQQSGNDAICKAILLKHLGEPNPPNLDAILASNKGQTTVARNVAVHAKSLLRLLQQRTSMEGKDMTMAMLVKEWRSTSDSAPEYIRENPPGKDGLSVDDCERIIIDLLLGDVLQTKPQWNAYDTVIYFCMGPVGHRVLQSANPVIRVRLPVAPAESTTSRKKPRAAAAGAAGEWLVAQPKRKRAPSKKKAAPTKKKAAPKKKAARKNPEVIELLEDDEDDDEKEASDALWNDDDSDEECEFNG